MWNKYTYYQNQSLSWLTEKKNKTKQNKKKKQKKNQKKTNQKTKKKTKKNKQKNKTTTTIMARSLRIYLILEARVGQKSLSWIRLIMICYIVPWWPSWLSDQIAFSNSESDVVWRVLRLPPWPSSWILELNDSAILNLHFTPMPPIKFRLNLTYCFGGDVIWRISRRRPSWTLEQKDFSNSGFPYHPNASHHV